MQTRNPFIDDLTKMANGAMGALSGVKDEVEARVRDQIGESPSNFDADAHAHPFSFLSQQVPCHPESRAVIRAL